MNLLVIGVGNEFRGDDAAGLLVARKLGCQNLPGATVIEQSGEGVDLITAWEGYPQVFLIDAVQSGAKPGTIHRFDAHENVLPPDFFHFSIHAFGIAEAIEVARSLGELPPYLIVFGIEGDNFNIGSQVSYDVQHTLEQVIQIIHNEMELLNAK